MIDTFYEAMLAQYIIDTCREIAYEGTLKIKNYYIRFDELKSWLFLIQKKICSIQKLS